MFNFSFVTLLYELSFSTGGWSILRILLQFEADRRSEEVVVLVEVEEKDFKFEVLASLQDESAWSSAEGSK